MSTGAPFLSTFFASIRSVASACTLAGVGIYLHRRGFIRKNGTKTLAIISQQVTIPILLFTKVVYCNQNWSTAPCPNITSNLNNVLGLLVWPIYVVGWGLLVGYCMALISRTPPSQIRSVLAACAFANSTGMPITLFAVLRSNFPTTAHLGEVDPTLFLSVYLLAYPILQWGVGGWLLKHEPEPAEPEPQARKLEEGLSRSETPPQPSVPTPENSIPFYPAPTEATRLMDAFESFEEWESVASQEHPDPSWCEVFCARAAEFGKGLLKQLLQPPVVGAASGFLVAATPLRGIFVDLIDRNASAPLQWFFDALYTVGQAAVPINMMILGINLSQSQQTLTQQQRHHHDDNDSEDNTEGDKKKSKNMSRSTMLAIVVGKMIIMPIIGFASVIVFDKLFWHVSSTMNAPFCLVAMIVFITPTANNVMVMVELSGGNKESIARVIAWQYAAAPLLLSLSVSFMVGTAIRWA